MIGFVLTGIACIPLGYAIIYKFSGANTESLGVSAGYRITDRPGFSVALSGIAGKGVTEKFYSTIASFYGYLPIHLPETLFRRSSLIEEKINAHFIPENRDCKKNDLEEYRNKADEILWYQSDFFNPREGTAKQDERFSEDSIVIDPTIAEKKPKAILFIAGDQRHKITHIFCDEYLILKPDVVQR